MPHLFQIESICDLSASAVEHCAQKFHVPHQTIAPQEVIDHPNVDCVFILTSDESHAPLVIAALQAGKNVFVEKPVSLSIASVQSIVEAEKNAPSGARVFVGYMRRYAPSFVQAFKREIATIPRILYARVRDFCGPNPHFISQSGTFPVKNSDYPANATEERSSRLKSLYAEAFPDQEITDEKRKICHFLGSLGSHDISLMREALGFPEKVVGVSANDPFYSAIMTFRNPDGSTYSTTYESGIDSVPIFDAHMAVYGASKRVTIKVCWRPHEDLSFRLTCSKTTQTDAQFDFSMTALMSRGCPSTSKLKKSMRMARYKSAHFCRRTRTRIPLSSRRCTRLLPMAGRSRLRSRMQGRI